MSHRNVFVPRLGTSNTQQSPCSTTEQRHDVSAPAIAKTGCPPHTPLLLHVLFPRVPNHELKTSGWRYISTVWRSMQSRGDGAAHSSADSWRLLCTLSCTSHGPTGCSSSLEHLEQFCGCWRGLGNISMQRAPAAGLWLRALLAQLWGLGMDCS